MTKTLKPRINARSVAMSGEPTVISTFAGCGGSSLGYQWAGFRELLAIEWDANAVATFQLNFPDVPVWQRDICEVTADEILSTCNLSVGELDVLDGSPPCQGFSTAGKRQVMDPRNDLFKQYVRLIEGLQPRVFVMENVSGMVKGSMKGLFKEIMLQLKGTGYQVKCRLMNAMYYGVPQSRQRLIFIGSRSDMTEPSYPVPQGLPLSLRSVCPDVMASRSERINPWIPSCRPCCTITKTAYRGLFRVAHGERAPSLAELKELSSFPVSFIFAGNDNAAWARIGNSVMPKFMQAIATHIRTEILGCPDCGRVFTD